MVGSLSERGNLSVKASILHDTVDATAPSSTPTPQQGSSSRRRRRSVPLTGIPVLDETPAVRRPRPWTDSALPSTTSNKTIGKHKAALAGYLHSRLVGLLPRAAPSPSLVGETHMASVAPLVPNNLYEPTAIVFERSPDVVGVLLELHLYGVKVEDLHKRTKHSMIDFLLFLQGEFSQATELSQFDVKLLGVHGYFTARPGETSEGPGYVREQDQVIVNLLVTPTTSMKEGVDKARVITAIANQVQMSSNQTDSAYASVLGDATVVEGDVHAPARPRAQAPPTQAEVGPMLIPVAISATFAAIIVWVAAI